MRRSILLPFLVSALGCGGGSTDYTIVDQFLARAKPLDCSPVELDHDYAVTELRTASDSVWTLLDESQRLVAAFDDELNPLWTLRYSQAGPGAVQGPVSAVALGDSAVAIAARGNLRLVVLSRAGAEIRSTPIEFVPAALAAEPDGSVLVSAMPMGDTPPTLLERWAGDSLSPVPIPRREYPDMMIGGLGNTMLVETLGDGTALAVHQFFEPRGFAVASDGAVEKLSVPTPDATRDQIEFVPTAPITKREILRMLVPAIAMSVDRGAREVYLMTRSGRMAGDRPQRAILRLDRHLGFLEGFTADVPAGAMVYLPRRHTVLLADDEDRFHACILPDRDVTAARAQRVERAARTRSSG